MISKCRSDINVFVTCVTLQTHRAGESIAIHATDVACTQPLPSSLGFVTPVKPGPDSSRPTTPRTAAPPAPAAKSAVAKPSNADAAIAAAAAANAAAEAREQQHRAAAANAKRAAAATANVVPTPVGAAGLPAPGSRLKAALGVGVVEPAPAHSQKHGHTTARSASDGPLSPKHRPRSLASSRPSPKHGPAGREPWTPLLPQEHRAQPPAASPLVPTSASLHRSSDRSQAVGQKHVYTRPHPATPPQSAPQVAGTVRSQQAQPSGQPSPQQPQRAPLRADSPAFRTAQPCQPSRPLPPVDTPLSSPSTAPVSPTPLPTLLPAALQLPILQGHNIQPASLPATSTST